MLGKIYSLGLLGEACDIGLILKAVSGYFVADEDLLADDRNLINIKGHHFVGRPCFVPSDPAEAGEEIDAVWSHSQLDDPLRD